MRTGKVMELFQSLLEVVQPYFTAKRVVRFSLILGASLYIDYLLPLLPVCRPLTTPYEILFCPLLIMIYTEEGGISFWAHICSLHSLIVAALAAAIFALLEVLESKFHH